MVAALGINAYTVSFFHLYTHAFFKALLFLCAGSVIMSLHHKQDITKMGGLREKLPITFYCFLIGTLCIIGFPFTSGFFSKDLILEVMLYENTNISFFVYSLLLLGALVTTVYSLRLIFIVFYGNYRGGDLNKIHEESYVILTPLIILSFLSLVSGFAIKTFVDLPIFMFGIKDIHYEGLIPFITHGILSPASVTLIIGFLIAKYLKKKFKIHFISNNLSKEYAKKLKKENFFLHNLNLKSNSITEDAKKTITRINTINKKVELLIVDSYNLDFKIMARYIAPYISPTSLLHLSL